MLRKFLMSTFLALVTSTPVLANPDVWVTTTWHFRMSDQSASGFTLEWTFDPFASSYLFTVFDADGDGTVTSEEAQANEDGLFAPLAEQDWYLTILGSDESATWHVQHVEPVFEPEQFGLRLTISLDNLQAPFAASLHDDILFFDFSFAGDGFLTVEGPLDPTCRFVAGRGEGAFEGHFSTITLHCGDPP